MASHDLIVCFKLAYRELITVPKSLGSLRPAEVKPSIGTALTVGTFGLKAEYVPFEQGLGTLCRRLKKPTLLNVPSDENM